MKNQNNRRFGGVRASDFPVYLYQVAGTKMTTEYGTDSGYGYCTGVMEWYEYQDDKKTDKQIGWIYQTMFPTKGLSLLVKVADLNCIFVPDELAIAPIPVRFTNFKGTFYVDSRNFLALSCKADRAERAVFSAEVF